MLDDSRITVSTIASSRYVAPIKEKVEEWHRHLNLMNETLVSGLSFKFLNCFSYKLYCFIGRVVGLPAQLAVFGVHIFSS